MLQSELQQRRFLHQVVHWLCSIFVFPPSTRDPSLQSVVLKLGMVYARWYVHMIVFLKGSEGGVQVVERFWMAVMCARPDALLSLVGAAQIWVYVCWTAVIWCYGLLSLLYIRRSSDMSRIKQIARISFFWMSSYLTIHIATGLTLSWYDDPRFGTGLSKSLQSWAPYVSLPLYLAFLLLGVITRTVIFDVDIHSKDLFSGSDVSQDILSFFLVQFCVFSYFQLNPRSYILHLGLICLCSFLVTLRHIQHLPYYSSLHNWLFIWSRGSLSVSALSILIGHLLQSQVCGVILLLAMTLALFAILMLSFDDYQTRRIAYSYRNIRRQETPYKRELGLRPFLLSTDTDNKLLNSQILIDHLNWFISVVSKTQIPRLLLIKHFVMKYALENERAARMCLCQAEEKEVDLYDRFLLIKSEWQMTKSHSLEELSFLKYLQKIQTIRHNDESICREMCEFWSEIGSSRPNFNRIISLSKRISVQIKVIKCEFKQAIECFPGTFEVYDLFGSFQEEVMNKIEFSKQYRTKAAAFQKDILKTAKKDDINSISFFDYHTGIILVDLHPNTFLDIIYMNSTAEKLLKYSKKEHNLLKLPSLIPPPYDFEHIARLKSFVKSTMGGEIGHPTQLPLRTATGHIIFCLTKLLFTSFEGRSLLAITFKQVNSIQEGAVLTQDMVVQAHTSGFTKCLGSPTTDIIGKVLTDIRPSIARVRSANGTSPCFLLFQNRAYCGLFTTELYANRRMHFIFTFASSKDCSNWDFAVNDLHNSLFISSNIGSNEAKSNVLFLSENLGVEAESVKPSSFASDQLSRVKNTSFGKDSSTSDSHSRERLLLHLNTTIHGGQKACTLIAIFTVFGI